MIRAFRPAWRVSVTAICPASPGKRARRMSDGRPGGEDGGTTSAQAWSWAGLEESVKLNVRHTYREVPPSSKKPFTPRAM